MTLPVVAEPKCLGAVLARKRFLTLRHIWYFIQTFSPKPNQPTVWIRACLVWNESNLGKYANRKLFHLLSGCCLKTSNHNQCIRNRVAWDGWTWNVCWKRLCMWKCGDIPGIEHWKAIAISRDLRFPRTNSRFWFLVNQFSMLNHETFLSKWFLANGTVEILRWVDLLMCLLVAIEVSFIAHRLSTNSANKFLSRPKKKCLLIRLRHF